MQPTTAPDFLKVALQRRDVTIQIIDVVGRPLEAQSYWRIFGRVHAMKTVKRRPYAHDSAF
jgi:hypothetical protein